MSTYDRQFYLDNIRPAEESAKRMLPDLIHQLHPVKVIDVGCGAGSWLAVAESLGCDVAGIDGDDMPDEVLQIDAKRIKRVDLATEGVGCVGYDLAMCLEVAEHIPESAARQLVAGLCEAQYVLFSPAIPGQRGVNHINEQWGSWWAVLFAEHGYVGSSDLKWKHWDDRNIANYYRQNMLLFAAPQDMKLAGFREGVIDVIHPTRLAMGW